MLAGVGVDGYHGRSPGERRRHDGREPDGPQPEDGNRLAGVDRRSIEDGPHAGEHRAAEHRRHGVRDVLVNGHHGLAGHDGVIGKRRDAQVVVDPLAGRRPQQRLTVQEVARTVDFRGPVAERGAAGLAGAAVPAARHEDQHHVIADRNVRNALPHGRDPTHGLVAQRHRERPDPGAVHHGEVRVAQAGIGDVDAQFTGAGLGPLQVLHHQRLRFGVAGSGRDGGIEDCCSHEKSCLCVKS